MTLGAVIGTVEIVDSIIIQIPIGGRVRLGMFFGIRSHAPRFHLRGMPGFSTQTLQIQNQRST